MAVSISTQSPQYLQDAYQYNLGRANNVSQLMPVRQFSPFTGDQQRAFDMNRQYAQNPSGINTTNDAIGMAQQVGQYQPMQVQAGSFLNGNMSAYMNPYTQSVTDFAMADLNRAREMAMGSNSASATRAKAFGGDRHALVDAETNRNYLQQAGQLSAGLNNQAFNVGANLMQSDLQRSMQGQMANQNAGGQAAQLGLQGANLVGNLGQQQQSMQFGLANQLGSAGQVQQNFAQNRLDALRNLPLEQQQVFQSALSLQTPSMGQTQSTNYSGSDAFLRNAGTAATFAGLLEGFF